MACVSPCLRCSSLVYCLSCQESGAVLNNGICLTNCPDGQFIGSVNGIASCVSCHASCATCSSAASSACSSCRDSSKFILQGSCADCPPGMFGNRATGECTACVAPCATCTGFAACASCLLASHLLVRDQCLALASCPSQTFLQQKVPRSCQPTCDAGLADPNSNQCVSRCPADFYPSSGTCKASCEATQYLAPDLTCQPCTNSLGVTHAACSSPLLFTLELKTYFNDLLLFVKFNRPVNSTLNFTKANFRINLYPYLTQGEISRRLRVTTLPLEVTSYDSSTVRMSLATNQTLTYEQLELWMVGVDGKITDSQSNLLQNAKSTTNIPRFDEYSE